MRSSGRSWTGCESGATASSRLAQVRLRLGLAATDRMMPAAVAVLRLGGATSRGAGEETGPG